MGRGAPRGPPGPTFAAATPHRHTSVRCTHGRSHFFFAFFSDNLGQNIWNKLTFATNLSFF